MKKYVIAEGSGWKSLDVPEDVMAGWKVGTVLSVGDEQRLVCGIEDVDGTRRFHLVRCVPSLSLEKEKT